MIDCPSCDGHELPGALYCGECGEFLLAAEKEPDGTLYPFTNVPGPATEPSLLGQQVKQPVHADAVTFVIPSSGRRVRLSLAQEIRVGRRDHAAGVTPELDLAEDEGMDAGVSRLHATINSSAEGVFVVDQNSTNGTQLNDFRLPPELPYPLHDGDELRFGQLLVHVFLE
ncbi:MAG TPA: FHA domain-containing protein [Candidatus Sulfomarinibacteraceae bacterium]|nr:FHA domain-containing protein [Candidatus Sulfomarinibacteraceae bacterium]